MRFKKEDIVRAALDVTRKKGIDAVTARQVALELRGSVGPIFSCFESMDHLKAAVYDAAHGIYREYIARGLASPIPFQGLWRQYLLFAREEKELYRLLFLRNPGDAAQAMKVAQDLARSSLMRSYHLDAPTADRYFRDLWLVSFGFASMIVTGSCPYTEEEIVATGTEISLAVLKAYKEIPGLPEGTYDRDAAFVALIGRARERMDNA